VETPGDVVANKIKGRYLLATVCCPCYVDASGIRYIDPLWAKDLAMHAAYIEHFTLASPRIDAKPPASFVSWELSPLKNVRVVDLPEFQSIRAAVRGLPGLAASLWAAIGRADIVHCHVAGWPIPDGWITIPMARLRRRFVIVVVESDFWQTSDQGLPSFKRKWQARAYETLNRWCISLVHVGFFTHKNYMLRLLTRGRERGHVVPASWLDDTVILTDSEAHSSWQSKLQTRKTLRLVFVGRLIFQKGVIVLLEALRHLQSDTGAISCDIVGEGPLMEECIAMAHSLKGKVEVKFIGPVQYGLPLFHLLDGYDAILVPNLSNEQPRIVYDAFARAIPAIGFRTNGLESCIEDGVTGRLCSRGSVQELGALIDWAAVNRPELANMGMAGISVARGLTHREMHRRRGDVLAPLIARHLREHYDLPGSDVKAR
jgi:glycosyltransferase involved in cell wall biosynthesis